MKHHAIKLRWFNLGEQSRGIEEARQRLCRRGDREQAISLQDAAISTRTGSEDDSWCALKDSSTNRTVGEVIQCKIPDCRDPVQSYVVVHLWSGDIFEAIELRRAPGDYELYVRGGTVGRLAEERMPEPRSFWHRLHGGARCWQLLLHNELVGRIELEYPLTKRSQLLIELNSRRTLPIVLASVWGDAESKYVIPRNASGPMDRELQELHFLLAVVFRRCIFGLDYCTGS